MTTCSLDFDADGRTLFAAGAWSVLAFDVATGEMRSEAMLGVSTADTKIIELDLNAAGTLVALASLEGLVRIWHPELQFEVTTLRGHSRAVTLENSF